MAKADKYLEMGRIGKTYGVKGWLKLYSHASPASNILEYQPWFIKKNSQWTVLPCDNIQQKGEQILIHIKGYDTPEHAKQLTGADIAISAAQLPELPKGEYYWHDLLTLAVYTQEGHYLGRVVHVINNAAHPILEIKGEDQQHLIPFVMNKFVVDINLTEEKIIVDWDLEF